MSAGDPGLIRYVNIEPHHAPGLIAIELASFPGLTDVDLLHEADILRFCEVFPQGGFVALDGDMPVGMGLGILVDFDFDHPNHTLESISGEHQCGNHDPDGDWYYGINISVHPDYRGRGIGARLYECRKDLVRSLGRRGIVAGGVIPGYADHIDAMSAEEYIDRVARGELHDPTLTFQIENGFTPRAAIPDYMEDAAVGNWAVLIVWENPDHAAAVGTAGDRSLTEQSETRR